MYQVSYARAHALCECEPLTQRSLEYRSPRGKHRIGDGMMPRHHHHHRCCGPSHLLLHGRGDPIANKSKSILRRPMINDPSNILLSGDPNIIACLAREHRTLPFAGKTLSDVRFRSDFPDDLIPQKTDRGVDSSRRATFLSFPLSGPPPRAPPRPCPAPPRPVPPPRRHGDWLERNTIARRIRRLC